MVEYSQQSEPERDVRTVLAAYKMALVSANYRNWWHRMMLWSGDSQAREAEHILALTRSAAVRVCNQSERHRNWVRLLSEQQPSEVRAKDMFLDLIQQT